MVVVAVVAAALVAGLVVTVMAGRVANVVFPPYN